MYQIDEFGPEYAYYTGATFNPETSTIWIAHTSEDGSAVRDDLD